METKNHLQLGSMLAQKYHFSRHTTFFLFGNVLPDLNFLSYFKGHTYRSRIAFIEKKINQLFQQPIWNWKSYYDLGIITHYVADFYTFPHNTNFKGSLRNHFSYEKKLRFYFYKKSLHQKVQSKNNSSYALKNPKQILQHLQTSHKNYMDQSPSLNNDFHYIIEETTILLESITRHQKHSL